MYDLQNKQVLVTGLGARGRAACELLRGSGRERHWWWIRPTRRICAPRRRGCARWAWRWNWARTSRRTGSSALRWSVPPCPQQRHRAGTHGAQGGRSSANSNWLPAVALPEHRHRRDQRQGDDRGTGGVRAGAEPAQGGVVRARVAAGVFRWFRRPGTWIPGVAGQLVSTGNHPFFPPGRGGADESAH